MKKFVCVFLLVFLLVGCSDDIDQWNSNSLSGTGITAPIADEMKFFSVVTDPSFYELIFNNPIDATNDIFVSGLLSQSEIILYNEYRKQWESQISKTLQGLSSILSETDYQKLLDSQLKWNEYMVATTKIERSLYYLGGAVGDGMSYPLVSMVQADRTRARAIELMSLEFFLTDTIQFITVSDFEEGNKGDCKKALNNYFVITQEHEFFEWIAEKDSDSSNTPSHIERCNYWLGIEKDAMEYLESVLETNDYQFLAQAVAAWEDYAELTKDMELCLQSDTGSFDVTWVEQMYEERVKAEIITILSYQYSIESNSQ